MTDEFAISPDAVSSSDPECDYCGLPIHDESDEDDAPDYCSDACANASADGLPTYDDALFFQTGVSAIDASMPQGMPRNTISLISGEAGTRIETVLVELAWRALERGEPVVLVTVSDPPLTMLHQFLTLKWNIIPHLEDGRLRIIDCYTYRNSEEQDVVCGAWDAHLKSVAEDADAITRVHDPTQPKQIRRHLQTAAGDLAMDCRGSIIIDSLTELGTLLRQVRAYELVKNLRADYCKARNVTVFCGAHYSGNTEEFPHEMEYLFDGIFDISLDPNTIPNVLLKQFIVRKMRGVMTVREQHAYEFMEHAGMMLINPAPEEPAPEDTPSDGGETDGTAETPSKGDSESADVAESSNQAATNPAHGDEGGNSAN